MAMIQPENQEETQYAFALAALEMHSREQREKDHKPAANQFLEAKRELAASGEERFRDRNNGLIEYADVLALTPDKPEAFAAFLETQKSRALKARAAKANVTRDEDDTIVVEKQDAHENQKEIEGELVEIKLPKDEHFLQDPTVQTTVNTKRTRVLKKDAAPVKAESAPAKKAPAPASKETVTKKETGRG